MSLPHPIRHDLDLQRREFVRWVGSGYEELLALGVDPSLWMACVAQTLEALKDAAAQERKAA